jgi:co-chaperonin GroES (HSP10)
MKVKPYGYKVIVEMEQAAEEFQGILLPHGNSLGLTDSAVVIELGISEKEYPVKIGDKVMVGAEHSTQILFDNRDAYIVNVENILAKIED